MTHLSVHRSVRRELLMLAAGVLLVLAAADIVWLHEVAGPPEVDEATQELTSRGRSQQRTDLMWGGTFAVVGGGMALLALGSLMFRKPVVTVTDRDLKLRIAGPFRVLSIPWENVSWVHSGSDGEDEAVPPRVLLVHVFDPSGYPQHLWATSWDGSTLMVDADSWNMPAVEVVAHARMALDAWRRDAALAAAAGEAPGEESTTDEGESPAVLPGEA